MYCTPEEIRKARKPHRCTNCGEEIKVGVRYTRWASYDDGKCFVNKMHAECLQELRDEADGGEFEYTPYSGDRPFAHTPHSLLILIREAVLMPEGERPDWFFDHAGLCYNYIRLSNEVCPRVHRLNIDCGSYITAWPMFSGNKEYPVPQRGETGEEAYDKAHTMFNLNTEYGRNRMALLDYLIEQTREQ